MALEVLEQLLGRQPSPKDVKDKTAAGGMSLLGSIYHRIDMMDSASYYMYAALAFFEDSGDWSSVASLSANLATNYIQTGDYGKALEFTAKAKEIFESENDSVGLAAVNERIGSVYAHQEVYDSALYFFEQSLEVAQAIEHLFFIANGYHNVGSVHELVGRLELGEWYLEKSIEANRVIGNDEGVAMTLVNLGDLDQKMGRLIDAQRRYEEALALADAYNLRQLRSRIYQNLADVAEAQRDYVAAYQYLKQGEIEEDSIGKLDMVNKIKSVEQKYIGAKQARQITEQELKLAKARNRYLELIIGAIIMGLILLAFGIQRVIENRRLKERNVWEQRQQQELKHRIENHLEQLSDLFEIQLMTQNGDDAVLLMAKSRLEAINLIYHKLSRADATTLNLADTVEQVVVHTCKVYGYDHTAIELEITCPSIELDAVKAQSIGQIVNELLNNTFQYAFVGVDRRPAVRVHLRTTGARSLEMIVADNGKGFLQEVTDQKNSMGLMLIDAYVNSMRGKLWRQSDSDGTRYTISLQI